MKVSSSGYYKWTKKIPSAQEQRREMVVKEIKNVYEKSKCRYGSPRITVELNKNDITASQPFVAKLMKKENIRSIVKKKFKVTTDSSHKYPVAENKLMQNFTVTESNQVWVSDLTYIHTAEGWVYLTTVIDLFDRKVIGWALSDRMRAINTSIPAFKMALLHRPLNN
jgi:putative transposase